MAQSGFTPIQLYFSTTASAAPSAGNLANGELALNITDGKLFYKDNGGVVQVLATKGAGSIGGSNTQVQYNNNGALAGSSNLTFDGTALTLGGNPTLSAGTANGVAYLNGSKVLTTGSALTFDGSSMVLNTSTSSDALRITQTGAGNALVVEDSANPDATPFVVNASGQVGVGTGSPSAALHISGDGFSGIFSTRYTSSASGNRFTFQKAYGTTASPAIVASGSIAGILDFSSYDGTQFVAQAEIKSEVDGIPGTNNMPGRLVFSTTAAGASTPTERMRIRSDGNISIGDGGSASQTLRIAKNTTGGATSASVNISSTIQSDVTTQASGFLSFFNTQAASFTLPTLQHFAAAQGTIGATSSVTNQYGFSAGASLTGATNNYGFYSNIAAGTGRWNFYANGTADNYFAGNLGLGVTPSAWNSSSKVLQLVGGNIEAFGSGALNLTQNGYRNSGGSFIYNNNGYASIYGQNSGSHQWYTAPSGTAGNAISFTQAMTLDASGNLGVGTTSPASATRLTLDYPGFVQMVMRSSGTDRISLYGDASVSAVDAKTNPLAFYAGGSERARIDSSGNFIFNKTTTGDGTVGSYISAGGTVSTTRAESTNATLNYVLYSTGAAAYRFYVGMGGTIFAQSTSISAISDRTLKENIRDLETGLSQVMALKPRRFDWKNGDAKNVAGFVAQEVEQVLPELVTDYVYNKGEDGNDIIKKSLKMGDILPTLVKAIQEQQAIITALTARVAALESNP
ncbi:MAG: hypothetical protein RL758_224 [Pseudomonadota bacterium]|jgi:hypothetical protein